jgi:uncharacterized protein YecT (DUF1311 family)
MGKALLVAIVLVLWMSATASATTTPKPSCLKSAGTQPAMNACAQLWLTAAQKRLTTAVGKARARFGQSLVSASQAAWMSYRNAECRLQASLHAGGSIHLFIYLTCEEGLTDARTTQIDRDVATTPHR